MKRARDALCGWQAVDDGAEPALRAELERVSRLRVFFGHQSVGTNLLDGLQSLCAQGGIPLRIAETPAARSVEPATFGHALIAENGKPMEKIRNFELAAGGEGAGPDIAMLKFCYLDITARTDVKALFAQYCAMAGRLRAAHPSTTIVHVTAPLTTVRTGPKAVLQRLLGRAPWGTVENLRREEYNALLRETYGGREPVFDLARAESTNVDGTKVTARWRGRVAPSLSGEHTDDGGHLNAAGGRRAARELIAVLATAAGRSASRAPSHR